MAYPLPIAAGGFELFLWLVIFLFYGIAQLARRSKQDTPQRPKGSPPARERSPEEELREFLKSLGGEQTPAAPNPPPVAARPRRATPPAVASTQPALRPPPIRQPVSDLMDVESRIEAAPPRVTTPTPRPARLARLARRADSRFEDVGDVAHPTMTQSAFLVGMTGLNMPVMSVPLMAPHSRHSSAHHKTFRGPKALKQAVISRVVLGAPKSIAPEEYNIQTGVM